MAKAKEAQEPSMEEILASIRRIISDEEPAGAARPAAAAKEPARPALQPLEPSTPTPASETVSEDDLDRLFAAEEPKDADGEDADGSVLMLTDDMAEEEVDEGIRHAADDDDLPETVDATEPDLAFVEPEARASEPREPESRASAARFREAEPRREARAQPRFDADRDDAWTTPPRAAPPAHASSSPHASSKETPDRLLSPGADASVQAAFGSLSRTILSANARTLDDLVADMLRPMLRNWLDENLPTLVERLVRQEIERISRGR